MTDQCDVSACRAEGLHEVGDTGRLCLKHVQRWDNGEDARLTRLLELQFEKPTASDEEVWAESYSEWCGAQR